MFDLGNPETRWSELIYRSPEMIHQTNTSHNHTHQRETMATLAACRVGAGGVGRQQRLTMTRKQPCCTECRAALQASPYARKPRPHITPPQIEQSDYWLASRAITAFITVPHKTMDAIFLLLHWHCMQWSGHLFFIILNGILTWIPVLWNSMFWSGCCCIYWEEHTCEVEENWIKIF